MKIEAIIKLIPTLKGVNLFLFDAIDPPNNRVKHLELLFYSNHDPIIATLKLYDLIAAHTNFILLKMPMEFHFLIKI